MRKSVWLLSLLLLTMAGCSTGPILILSAKSLTPTSIAAGTPATISVTGEQFSSRTAIQVGSTVLTSEAISPTQLTAALPPSLYNTPGSYAISLVDAEPQLQGGTGVVATSLVLNIQAPSPVTTFATPSTLVAGQPQADVTITGSGFLPSTTLTLNGRPHPVGFQDSQHLTMHLSASDLLVAQALTVTVSNAAPGGGNSGPLVVQLTNYTKSASTYSAYGDSITFGYQLSSITLAYPYLLASANNLNMTDLGIVGDGACDTMGRISNRHDGYSPQSNLLFSYMIGTNETYFNGSGAYEQVFNSCDQGVLSWLGLPSSAKVQPGNPSIQAGGACTNSPYAARFGAIYCSGAGLIVDESFETYGSPIYLWVLLDNGASASTTMQITVDGMQIGNFPVASNPAIDTINHASFSIGLIRVPVSAGSHSLSLAASGGGAGLLGIGTVPASRAGLPPVVVGDVPVQRLSSSYASTAVQLAYSADVRANVALLRGDGLDLRFAATRSTMTGTDAEMADSLHPDALGQQELQAAFQTGLIALNSSGGIVAQIARDRTPLPSAPIVLIAPETEGAIYTLPECSEAITIRNLSQVHGSWIAPEGSCGLINGRTGVTLNPGQTITLRKDLHDLTGWSMVISQGEPLYKR